MEKPDELDEEKRVGNGRFGLILFIVLLLIVVTAIFLIKKFTPSKTVMPLDEYYKVQEGQVLVVFQNTVYEKKGLYIDNMVYLDYETVADRFNKRFYWDANENILTYTTPTEVIKTEVGSKDYYVNKSKSSLPYQIVKTEGDSVYVALDYVKLYSNLEYEFYEEPNRVVIKSDWGKDFMYSQVKKKTQVRVEANIKSDILAQLTPEDVVVYTGDSTEEVPKGFCKVVTKDGIVGYVKNKHLKEAYYEKLENDYKAEQYSHITKDYTINMVWHQVTNMEANESLMNKLEVTKGVTTVAPTWFSVSSTEGEISSLASETYVDRAHNAGVEVWALCDDFNQEVNMQQLLTRSSRREKLINELIATAIKYNLDGLNIDFEKITQETGPHYIQFLRELSVKCRNNGIVLSVDSYVPTEYTAYYDREEQGEIIDYVVVMAYDEHYAGSKESGSVSSIGFVKNAVDNIVKQVPPERVIIGIPYYTRLWKEIGSGESVEVTSEACGMGQGLSYLETNGVEPVWDDETGQYYGEYEQDGARFRIWLEEDESIELKLKTIDEANVAGIAGWKLGLEKESVWNVIIKYVN